MRSPRRSGWVTWLVQPLVHVLSSMSSVLVLAFMNDFTALADLESKLLVCEIQGFAYGVIGLMPPPSLKLQVSDTRGHGGVQAPPGAPFTFTQKQS